MKEIGPLFFQGLSLLLAVPASAQVSNTRIDDVMHDGWYLRGSTRADVEARIAGANGTSLSVDCKGDAPRVIIVFRKQAMPAGSSLNELTAKRTVDLTFRFVKRGIVSGLTSYFDRESVQSLAGEQISSGRPNEPPSSEQVNFVGERVPTIVGQLRSMDNVSVGAPALGQPMTFDLKDAASVIDRVLPICSSGP